MKFDRVEKATLYAMADVPEYWILNVRDRVVEVHREPQQDAKGHYGYQYQSIAAYGKGDVISPLCRPDVVVAVSDLLPE